MKQTSEFEDRVKSVKQVTRARSWAFYGRSGSGKTTLAATFPRPILVLDIRDHGTDSIADQEDIDVFDVNSMDDLEMAYYSLREQPKRYKTVILDTVTQLQQIFMEEVMTRKKQRGRVGEWGSMSRREFGDVSALMKDWINDYRNLVALKIQPVFLAQERTNTTNDEEDNPDNMLTPEVGPQVMPSVATVLNANVSVIGNTFIRIRERRKRANGKIREVRTPVYAIRVGPNPIYTTKIRKPRDIEAPSYIENPTYEDLVAVCDGKGE